MHASRSRGLQSLETAVQLSSPADSRQAAVLYRSRSLRSSRLEARVRARLNLARLIATRLLEDVAIDAVTRFPDPDRAFADAEIAARELRAGWWLPSGPVDDVSHAIEAAGAVVLRVDLGADEVDAAYLHPLGDPTRWFFINTRTTAGDRVRFSLAHELGHAVLHEVDLLPDTRQAEDESNRFAGAFLLPEAELRAELPRGRLSVANLIELKRRWRVSMGAIAMRAHQIGVITRDDLTKIWREIGWHGMRTAEPVHVPVEAPGVFGQLLAIHRSEHGVSDDELSKVANSAERPWRTCSLSTSSPPGPSFAL